MPFSTAWQASRTHVGNTGERARQSIMPRNGWYAAMYVSTSRCSAAGIFRLSISTIACKTPDGTS